MRFDWLEAAEREIVFMFRNVSHSDVSYIALPQTAL
jgi:hypothetical protein